MVWLGAAQPAKLVVFFGGDVQDFGARMIERPESAAYVNWSLESAARSLSGKFPAHSVAVVRAAAFHRHTFARYVNFVMCNPYGVPKHASSAGAVCHLRLLLSRCAVLLGGDLERTQIALVGFSKGCVVLNQLALEAADCDGDDAALLRRVTQWHWLDGGHSGGEGTWLSDETSLRALGPSGACDVRVHVTPYQVRDPNRPHIEREEAAFSAILSRLLGDRFRRRLYFGHLERSLENHFRLLDEFDPDVE